MNEKLVTVARFSDYVEAELARQLLEAEGIRAFVMGENVGNVYAGVPAAIDIQLQTPESQAEKAIEILEASEQEAAESEREDMEQGWDEDAGEGPDEDLEQE
ncbi:MAG: DUF2007 domain-containing protein [Sedimentisphaerales bacterium]|nr:DUF2007 domain-containing protein [Sedimentisphaerales bacterium]